MTREQFAIFVLRASGVWSVPTYTSYSYNDIATSYARNWIQYLASERGITDYCSSGNYCPTASLTRERLAYLLVRVFNLPLVQAPLLGRQASLITKPHLLPYLETFNATFLYDGDGRRVAQTVNGVTTYFIGNYYEQSGSTVTKYYYAGSTRIAMRTGGTLYFLLSDHLGSTALTTDASGNVLSELRYTAWGEVRYNSGTTPTRYQYTGQYSYAAEFGLYFYNARWYDPSLGRFAQPDTLIPEQSQGVQAWDRYAYVSNNPLKYTDPSGHKACDDVDANGNCITYPDNSSGSSDNGSTSSDPNSTPSSSNPIIWYSFDGGWNYPWYSTWNLLRMGSPCAACHVTHWTGTIPTNDEISLTQVQGWRSFDKFALPVHAGGLSTVAFYVSESIAAAEESGGIQLYRGLRSDHPQLKIYLETGEVVPRGGSASVYEHVMGNTQSNYTSWTTNIEVAKGFAGPNGTILTVNTADIPNTIIPTYEWSPFNEFEILIEGIIRGAKPIP